MGKRIVGISKKRGRFAKDDGVGKVCISCHDYKELSEYYRVRNPSARSGFVYKAKCISCYNSWRTESGITKRYREANKSKVLTATRLWRTKNQDRANELNRRWRAENPEKVRELSMRYKANKRGATGEQVNLGLVLARAEGKCHICGHSLDGDISYDHIYPLSKGGKHSQENLGCAHLRCNIRKSDKTLTDFFPSFLLETSTTKVGVWF